MTMEKDFNVVVIGAGPGGYVAAIRAAQLGLRVAIVEANHFGGICLNWGCIPTKALLKSAEVYTQAMHAGDFGVTVQGVTLDFEKIIARSRDVSAQLAKGIQHLLKKNKVEVFWGRGAISASVKGMHHVTVTPAEGAPTVLKAPHVILATGARARSLPTLKADGKTIWSYREAMVPKALPKSLLVIGSGAIGIEFASFYKALGTDVTVVEVLDRILPAEDPEISTLARKAFEARGMKIHTSATLESVVSSKNGATATLTVAGKKQTLEVEKVILSVGIEANTENLGLEKTKVQLEKGRIRVNGFCETDTPGIYAIGDLVGAPWLAHKASHEGVMVAEKIAGLAVHAIKRESIPGCTYSHPQIASLGLTEEAAKAAGHALKVGRFPFAGNGKALAMGETDGLVKTIFDAKTGELLGVHMIGAEVTELIQGFAIAKACEATEAELMATIFPHPTLSEMMHESVLNAFGRTIHF